MDIGVPGRPFDGPQNVAVRDAAHAVAEAGLSDAFGHVSARLSQDTAVITPPVPLGALRPDHDLVLLSLNPEVALPDSAPREAWLHVALMANRATGSVCRAQPPAVAALASLGIPFPVLTGHAAMLGPVAVFDDARLVRDHATAQRVAEQLGDGTAIILRGNGAVTRGRDVASAVAAMWVLERSARTALDALSAGSPRELTQDEAAWWRERADELLPRIAAHLIPDRKEYQ